LPPERLCGRIRLVDAENFRNLFAETFSDSMKLT
jgi:hypothetical protein